MRIMKKSAAILGRIIFLFPIAFMTNQTMRVAKRTPRTLPITDFQ
jgi:hypothetical protein